MSQVYGNGKYVVVTSAACMPNNCWGRYGKVAVIRRRSDVMPSIIVDSKNFDIIEVWDRLNIGSTDRCAFERAKARALRLAEELNARGRT